MPAPEDRSNQSPISLLAADEPEPFTVLNGNSVSPILLVCDHASDRIPRSLGTMGLDPPARRCHLAIDIGAENLARHINSELQTTTVICQYSRLVVDCNRELMDAGAFLEFGDGVVIPGNRSLGRAQKELRANEIYWPYHRAIAGQIERLRKCGRLPILVSIHSFTPVLDGQPRTIEMGIMWDADRPTSRVLIEGLATAGYQVGDNEPYSGKAPQDFTIDHHAEAGGLPHVGIEVRQDLISDARGVSGIGQVLAGIIAKLPDLVPAGVSDSPDPVKVI